MAKVEELIRGAQVKCARDQGPVEVVGTLRASESQHAERGACLHSLSPLHLLICPPLDTPQGLGRGYFVSGGLVAC